MTINPTKNHRDIKEGSLSGVLFLNRPAESENPIEWYSTKIAGVPFALRNILTFERLKFSNLAIYMEYHEENFGGQFDKIIKDSRISQKITLINNTNQLQEWILSNPEQVYIFNGSALHDKKKINRLITSPTENEIADLSASSINPKNLESFLLNLQNDPEHLKTNNSNDDLQSGFPIYIQGSKETKINQSADFNIAHEIQVKGSGLNHDSPITRIFSRPASRLLTRMFLNTPISPNQITIFSFFLGLLSAFFFLQGSYKTGVVAAAFLVISTWVDGADGEIARLKFMETEIGKKLDIYCDNIVHFLVFTAIGIGIHNNTGENIYLYLGTLAGVGSLMAFFLLSPILLEKRSPSKQMFHMSDPDLAEKFANRDFIHFLFLVSLIDQLEIFILVAAVGANLFAGFLVFSRFIKLRTV